MEMVAGLPALLALAVCLFASPARAFLDVYLPCLLLVPYDLFWSLPGLPDLTFQSAAILPIAAVLACSRTTRWTWSTSDGLLLLLVAAIATSEFQAAGEASGQNILVELVCGALLPYAVGKVLIASPGFAERLAKRVVLLLALVAVLSAWQFRMGSEPFFRDFWPRLFPDYSPYWTNYRWGFGRITGPYGHAILAGIVLGIGLLLQVWLHASRRWRSRLWSWGLLGALAAGCLMTMSRGPWIGLAVGIAVTTFGWARSRLTLASALLVTGLLIGPPAVTALQTYTAVERVHASSRLQENAAYRAELMDSYLPVVEQRPWLGWGRRLWPKVPGQGSVDNAYLFLALNHGLLSVAALVLLMGWVVARVTLGGFRSPARSARCQLLFVLLACMACTLLSMATVWLGHQTQPLLFLLVGCAEGLLLGARRRAVVREVPAVVVEPASRFQRVLT